MPQQIQSTNKSLSQCRNKKIFLLELYPQTPSPSVVWGCGLWTRGPLRPPPSVVLQLWNVLVEVQGVGVGEGPPLGDLAAGQDLLHRHLHLLPTQGVLRRRRDTVSPRLRSGLSRWVCKGLSHSQGHTGVRGHLIRQPHRL